MKVLVTGGAGFIGSNLVKLLLEDERGLEVINVDKLTYAGNLENLAGLEDDTRYRFVLGDIADTARMDRLFEEHKPDVVMHLAAESHVDRSIEDASPFIKTNILGTQVLLDCSSKHGIGRFIHVSTDEVYGSLSEEDPAFTEDHRLDPSSPYSASKAASDLLALACHKTHGLPAMITRCSNNYGPCQFPEKLIPLMILGAMSGNPLPVYGDGSNIRDWIHVKDHCKALIAVMDKGTSGELYNIGGEAQIRNVEVVQGILGILGKPESLIRYVKDRPAHDQRYAMNIEKIRKELDWSPSFTFARGLEETVQWYRDNSPWVDHVASGEYREYYDRMYSGRLEEHS